MQTLETTTKSNQAEVLSQELLRLGFVEGAPGHIPTEYVEIDRRCARAMRCGSCGKRGLVYRPFRRGRDYRALASCEKCGSGESM